MANTSISNLSAGAAVSATDLVPNVQTVGVGPVKTTAAQLKTFMSNSPTLVTPDIGAATGTTVALGGATLGSNVWAATGNASLSGTLVMGSTFQRNRIINGGMGIDQRNNGAAQTFTAAAAIAYNVDRFYASCTGANVAGQRVAGPTGFQYCYQFTGAASVTGILFGQRIESVNCNNLVNQDVVLSANISNSLLTTVTWTAYYANSADNFSAKTQIATGTFTVSSTATTYQATFNAGANAANGVAIEFTVGAQTSGTWKITGVQLEPGTVATPFERRQYGQELMLCQRYLPAFRMDNATSQVGVFGTTENAAEGFLAVKFPVTTRTAPTGIVLSAAANFTISDAATSAACTSLTWTVVVSNEQGLLKFVVSGTPYAAFRPVFMYANSTSAYLYFTGIEL